MIIETIARGMLGANCYIVIHGNTGVVIDPCVKEGHIASRMEKYGLTIPWIIITHAHVDHILHLEETRNLTGAKTAIHELEDDFLGNPLHNGSLLFGMNKVFPPADMILRDNDILRAGDMEMEIRWTPGHSPGGICILVDGHVFTGDTLFYGSVGRTDLGNGSQDDLIRSIRNKLMVLPDDTVVHPGHGTATSIGRERKHNIYI
ncbi:MAG: MBL fold metallo-hydrolase [Clostridia bacterium]